MRQSQKLIRLVQLCNCSQFFTIFLKLGASLLADILIASFKLMSVSKDLFFDLFIFKKENACLLMYVDLNSVKNLAAKFFEFSGAELTSAVNGELWILNCGSRIS